MNYGTVIELGYQLQNIEIPNICCETNFWLLRSKGGFFYNEFVNNNFIALGWNYITKETSYEDSNIENVKDKIKILYGDKVPTTAMNKCKRFIYELKEGDYVVIPNKGSSEIAICKVGKYYENDYDVSKEILEIRKIDNSEYVIGNVRCPYRKRRKIEVLIKIQASKIGLNLVKAISSYHGLSALNSCSTDILNCVYDCYEFQGDLMFSINIAKKDPIKARELSKFMYGITELFCAIADEDSISITVNLNSPGKTVLKLRNQYEKIKKSSPKILLLYVAIFGGSAFGFEFNSIPQSVVEVIKEVQTMEADVQTAKEELTGKQLDNYLKVIEVIKECKDNNIDTDQVLNSLEVIEKLDKTMNFQSNEKFAEPIVEENQKDTGKDEEIKKGK